MSLDSGSMKNPCETEERRLFRETIKRYVEAEITPNADEWDEAGDFPWRIHEELGAMGYFGFGVSEEFGGLGFDDAFMRAAASEEMTRSGATGIWAGVGGRGISIGPLESFASQEIRARVLEDVVMGRKGIMPGDHRTRWRLRRGQPEDHCSPRW